MIPYERISKQVALKANQLGDAVNNAAFNTAFGNPTANILDGLEVPYAALKLAVLASESALADLIGHCRNPLLRMPMIGATAEIESGGDLPFVNTNGKPFVGVLGSPFDSANNQPLTEKSKQEIFRIINNQFYKADYFHFCLEDTRIYHTRGAVYFKGCVWDYETQAAAFNALGSSPLPVQMENFWIAHVLAHLPQEDWFVSESGIYSRIAESCEMRMKEGILPMAVLPNATAKSEPVKD